MKYLHFTIDCDYIPNSNLVFEKLLEFIDYNKLEPTFFLTGMFANKYPELCKHLASKYEIGCHGLAHGLCTKESFDSSSNFFEKFRCLEKATHLIEHNTGIRPAIFRAPYLRISDDTLSILQKLGYKIDSSIPSRRFDFFKGSINNLKYFSFPILPIYLSNGLLEIPPSALLFPLNIRFIKTFGVKTLIHVINTFMNKRRTIVFYLHPGELIDNRQLLEYPKEKDYFYRGGGLYLLSDLQLLINFLFKQNYTSIKMTHQLKITKY